MLDPKKLQCKIQLQNINEDIIKYKNETQTLMRLYSIKPVDIANCDNANRGWREYTGDVSSNDPHIPESMLKSTYHNILSGLENLKAERKNLKFMDDGNGKQNGLEKLKHQALNVASLLTQHDNPTIHLKGDEYNLKYEDDGKVKHYPHYSIKISPSWMSSVAKKNLSIQDIAGREAMVLHAKPLPDTVEGYEAYATSVVTIRRPISNVKQIEVAKAWEAKHLKSSAGTMVRRYSRDFKHPAFLTYETRYVVRTMTTDGWKSCTGTTVNWAASTLKRRMKTIMLKKLSV